MLRQSGGDSGRGARSTANTDGPVGPTETLGVELADDPHDVAVEQAPIAAGDGLLGGAEDLGQSTERRSGIDVEGLDDSSVNHIDGDGSHSMTVVHGRNRQISRNRWPGVGRAGRLTIMEKKWWTLVVVCAATFMLLLDVTIVIVALPTIQRALHASFSEVQWVVDAYALTLASVLLTAGSLADRYGRRLLFTIGLIVFTLGSLLCGVAQSPIMLILSRSGQGIGGAIMFATSLALLAQSFHGQERGVAFGVWGAITGVAVGTRPGARRGHHHRHQLAGHLLGEPADRRGRGGHHQVAGGRVQDARMRPGPDWAGFATPHRGAGQPGLRPDPRRRDQPGATAGSSSASSSPCVFLGAFVVVERRGEHPLFDLALFRIPTFSGGLIAAFAMNGSLTPCSCTSSSTCRTTWATPPWGPASGCCS